MNRGKLAIIKLYSVAMGTTVKIEVGGRICTIDGYSVCVRTNMHACENRIELCSYVLYYKMYQYLCVGIHMGEVM